jgi:type IV fimbrial biogenesis protein FimT
MAGPARCAAAGFTLIELIITIAILGLLITLAVPSLSASIQRAKVNSIADFYLDGLRLARTGALQKSGASRFVLTANANGQYDWQVDWCFPTSTKPCDTGGAARWSTVAAAGSGDTNAANPSLSVLRSAGSQPPSTKVTITLAPPGVLSIYFNSQGWVNTGVQPFLRSMRFDSDPSYNPNALLPNVRPVSVAINLSGMAERCDPMVAVGDSRACSP